MLEGIPPAAAFCSGFNLLPSELILLIFGVYDRGGHLERFLPAFVKRQVREGGLDPGLLSLLESGRLFHLHVGRFEGQFFSNVEPGGACKDCQVATRSIAVSDVGNENVCGQRGDGEELQISSRQMNLL